MRSLHKERLVVGLTPANRTVRHLTLIAPHQSRPEKLVRMCIERRADGSVPPRPSLLDLIELRPPGGSGGSVDGQGVWDRASLEMLGLLPARRSESLSWLNSAIANANTIKTAPSVRTVSGNACSNGWRARADPDARALVGGFTRVRRSLRADVCWRFMASAVAVEAKDALTHFMRANVRQKRS